MGRARPVPQGCAVRVPLPSPLTLILWKFTLQLAPALEGMKRSPCLLGEDTGELAGVRVRRISATWKDGRASWVPQSPQSAPRPASPPRLRPRPLCLLALGLWPLNEGLILVVTHVLEPARGTMSGAQFVRPALWV